MSGGEKKVNQESPVDDENKYIPILLDYIRHIEYGSVTVNIQDGRIVQIDKNEKIRIKK